MCCLIHNLASAEMLRFFPTDRNIRWQRRWRSIKQGHFCRAASDATCFYKRMDLCIIELVMDEILPVACFRSMASR